MSMPALFRTAAFAAAVGAAILALPAFADAPIAITFQDHQPWAQEVGNVTRTDSSHDYSVAVAAGQTLQINLVTRNPNVFFKVANGNGKQLIDSYTTGATTWSLPNTTAGTYSIHVYIQPEAIERGDTAKYALQVGQYGQADMQVPATTVTFEEGKPWVQTVGTLDAQGTARDYAVSIAAGEMFAVNLISHEPKVHFKVVDKTTGQAIMDNAQTGVTQWSMLVTTPTDFIVTVYADPAAMPPGTRVGYVAQIGHYKQASAPAAAGTAAPPPAASPAPAASSPPQG